MAASSAVTLAGANADLLVIDHLYVGTYTLLAIGAIEHYLVSADRALNGKNAACLTLLAGLNVLLYEVSALDDNLLLLGGYLEDLTDSALELSVSVSGDNDNGISNFYVKLIHLSFPP